MKTLLLLLLLLLTQQLRDGPLLGEHMLRQIIAAQTEAGQLEQPVLRHQPGQGVCVGGTGRAGSGGSRRGTEQIRRRLYRAGRGEVR